MVGRRGSLHERALDRSPAATAKARLRRVLEPLCCRGGLLHAHTCGGRGIEDVVLERGDLRIHAMDLALQVFRVLLDVLAR